MRRRTIRVPPLAIIAAATGAVAVGALAVGAIAIGALAIGTLAVRRLVIRDLTITGALRLPSGDVVAISTRAEDNRANQGGRRQR